MIIFFVYYNTLTCEEMINKSNSHLVECLVEENIRKGSVEHGLQEGFSVQQIRKHIS